MYANADIEPVQVILLVSQPCLPQTLYNSCAR
jgi:hypothetical protein